MESKSQKRRDEVLQQIRRLCDSEGRETDPAKSADYFEQLAQLLQSEDKRSLISRCVLLNASLYRLSDQSRRESVEAQIRSLGEEILNKSNARDKDRDLLEESRRLHQGLEKRRFMIKEEIGKLSIIPSECCELELLKLESERIETVRSIMEKVSHLYKQTMREVSTACRQMLGDPPCRFSHFAMGSLARDEITLYSDFENGIILDDNAVPEQQGKERENIVEYFRWYTVLFHVILINFGETPIHMVGIKGLNDQYSERKADNWLYDCHTPAGITFDSFLPFASKTPFGRKPTLAKNYTTELILPAREMLRFLEEKVSLTEGYHLSDMLVESRYVAGDEDLFSRYKGKSIAMMEELIKCPEYVQISADNAKADLEKFDLTPTLITSGWKQHTKKLYYRPMSVYIPWITRLCGVLGCRNSYEGVTQLFENYKKWLSEETKHNLHYALSVANQLRFEVYSARSRQSDIISGVVHQLKKSTQSITVFDVVGERSALDCYEISLGLRTAVIEMTAALQGGKIDVSSMLTILEKNLSLRGNLVLHGDIYRRFQSYDKAAECYQRALDGLKNSDSREVRVKEVEILMSLGLTKLKSLEFDKSIAYYSKAIQVERDLDRQETSKENIAFALTMMGQCYIEIPEIREANFAGCIDEGSRLWDELVSSDPNNEDYLRGVAEARDTEGFYYLRTLQYEKSLEKYYEAAKLFEKLYSEGNVNNDTIKVQNGIAMCLLRLERYEDAADMFGNLIRLKKSLLGDEVADVNLSWYLRSRGDALKNVGRFQEAIQSYKDSVTMREVAPGSDYDKYSAIGNTTRRLADCYFRCGRYEEALQTVDDVLDLVTHIPDTVKGREFGEDVTQLKKDIEEVLRKSTTNTDDGAIVSGNESSHSDDSNSSDVQPIVINQTEYNYTVQPTKMLGAKMKCD